MLLPEEESHDLGRQRIESLLGSFTVRRMQRRPQLVQLKA